jgi:hypothetical protein
MENKIDNEIATFRFFCNKCEYGCNKQSNFEQHKKTNKHNNTEHEVTGINKCLYCERNYKYERSLKRHLHHCKKKYYNGMSDTEQSQIDESNMEQSQIDESDTDQSQIDESDTDQSKSRITKGKVHTKEEETAELKGMIVTLLKQNSSILMENKEMMGMMKDMIPKIGNNNTTINNKFNLQLFLNEECKDAINITDFVQNLQLDMSDLDRTQQRGYASGIANIFIKGLRQLETHQRPIHCSDLKREIIYVKDNDTWVKDDDDKKIIRAINMVARKQVCKIKEWELNHPGWAKSSKGTQQYLEMVRNVTSSGNDDNGKSDSKIIKIIAKEITIQK